MLDMHRLRILRELKRSGTLAAVAATMSYSPATISQQLSQLEAEAGVRLLEPVGRGVRLTAEAELLVERTEELLAVMERAETDLAASASEVSGTVRLAIFQSAAMALLPEALSLLHREQPRLRVEVKHLEPTSALASLTTRDVDLAVCEEYQGEPLSRASGIEHEVLVRDPMRIAVPRTSSALQLADLRDATWVMEPEGTPARRFAFARCREIGFEPNVQFSSHDLLFHRRMIESGEAVGFLPDLVHAYESPGISLISISTPDFYRTVLTSARRGSGLHPRIIAVRTALARAVAG